MKDNKLISMVDFTLSFLKDYETDDSRVLNQILRYAEFLKQPLTLGMFVPCDEEGNVLEKPNYKQYDFSNDEEKLYKNDLAYFESAKEKVFFEGFEIGKEREYPKVSNGRLGFIIDEYGFWLCPLDSFDGQRIDSIEDLAKLNLSEEHLSIKNSAIKQILQ